VRELLILPVVVLAGALVALAGCTVRPTPPSPSAIVVPASSETPPVLERDRKACRGTDVTFSMRQVFPAGDAERGSDPPAAALRATIEARAPGDPTFPTRGWTIVVAGPSRVTYVADLAGHWAVATVAVDASGTWQLLEGGRCDLTFALPAGIGFASWRVDPAKPPEPGASHVSLLATELACAGGNAPVGRLLAPIVQESREAVLIGLTVTSLPAASDCPANEEFQVDVPLAEELRDRALYDLSSFPALLRS